MSKSDLILQELGRLQNVLEIISRYEIDRKAELARHDALIKDMEKERLESVSWQEKNDLADKLVNQAKYDPRKYLPEYFSADCPYFGILGFKDDDPQIGDKEYLIGKQSLEDIANGRKRIVIDWRSAQVSRLFYEYPDEGEEYDETIQGKDRTGRITKHHTVAIVKKELRGYKTPDTSFDLRGMVWYENGAPISLRPTDGNAGDASPQADAKFVESSRATDPENHALPDIVALISPEQFQIIAQQAEGCVYLQGVAGSGKTTVAFYRLSYLQFNFPEIFRPARCLAIMFNRPLCEYIKTTSADLLGGTKVETFFGWAVQALKGFGVNIDIRSLGNDNTRHELPTGFHDVLVRYAQNAPMKPDPVEDLFALYAASETVALFRGKRQAAFIESAKEKKLSFADIGPLLRLCQLRAKEGSIEGALGWYDHILVDEAQDFSLIDLECMLAATTEKKSLTICADENQKILFFINDRDFSVFKSQILCLGLEKKSLTVSYRCPPEIMALAVRVSGRESELLQNKNGGVGAVHRHLFDDKEKALERLKGVVSELVAADPQSLTAVICKRKADIPMLRKALAGVDGLHPDKQMQFKPGVLVTNAHQVKGLEFNNVVLWNPILEDYKGTKTDRNLLYVVLTRASRRLDMVAAGTLAKGLEEECSG